MCYLVFFVALKDIAESHLDRLIFRLWLRWNTSNLFNNDDQLIPIHLVITSDFSQHMMSGKVEKGEHVCLIKSNSFQLRIITYKLIISIQRKILWLTANHWWSSRYSIEYEKKTLPIGRYNRWWSMKRNVDHKHFIVTFMEERVCTLHFPYFKYLNISRKDTLIFQFNSLDTDWLFLVIFFVLICSCQSYSTDLSSSFRWDFGDTLSKG